MERLERARLRDGVLAAEEQRRASVNRICEVLELEPVGVRGRDGDALRSFVASELDAGRSDVPRILDMEAAVLAHHLELVAERKDEAAVEVCEYVIRQSKRRGEADVDAARTDDLLPCTCSGSPARRRMAFTQ